MFTGIVLGIGTLTALEPHLSGDVTLRIDVDDNQAAACKIIADAGLGDSICCSGVCLTVTELSERGFCADASKETLSCTTLGMLEIGSRLNLEPSLTLGTPLGGHLVSGHVDGVAKVVEREADARSVRFDFEVPRTLARYIARKGSICIDGVSLTVNSVDQQRFSVNIVPHTLGATTIGDFRVGTHVNLEVDQVARYVERLLESSESEPKA